MTILITWHHMPHTRVQAPWWRVQPPTLTEMSHHHATTNYTQLTPHRLTHTRSQSNNMKVSTSRQRHVYFTFHEQTSSQQLASQQWRIVCKHIPIITPPTLPQYVTHIHTTSSRPALIKSTITTQLNARVQNTSNCSTHIFHWHGDWLSRALIHTPRRPRVDLRAQKLHLVAIQQSCTWLLYSRKTSGSRHIRASPVDNQAQSVTTHSIGIT